MLASPCGPCGESAQCSWIGSSDNLSPLSEALEGGGTRLRPRLARTTRSGRTTSVP
jgi:hypothetical protein